LTDQLIKVEVQQALGAPIVIKRAAGSASPNGFPAVGQPVMVAIRPEEVGLWGSVPDGLSNLVPADLQFVQFLGDRYEYTVALGSDTRVLVSPASQQLKAGGKVYLELKSEGISLWPREG